MTSAHPSSISEYRRQWRWVLSSGIVFVGLAAMVFGNSVLVMLASVFVLGWALVFGGTFQAIHAFKVFSWSGFLLELLLAIPYVVVSLMWGKSRSLVGNLVS